MHLTTPLNSEYKARSVKRSTFNTFNIFIAISVVAFRPLKINSTLIISKLVNNSRLSKTKTFCGSYGDSLFKSHFLSIFSFTPSSHASFKIDFLAFINHLKIPSGVVVINTSPQREKQTGIREQRPFTSGIGEGNLFVFNF